MKPGGRWILDFFLILSILALAGIYLAANIDLHAAPAEDAAMLMRYAKHFGEGRGIVWNAGEAPVDGATDFLFMAALGGIYRLGIGLEAGVRGLGIAAHFLTLMIVYFGALQMSSGKRWAAWLSAAFLAFGPGLRYSEAAFGTPFFALFIALAWLAAIFAVERPSSTVRAVLFSLAALLAGLTRPEGVLACAFMALAVIVRLGFKRSRRILAVYIGVNLALGGAYFLWRWDYFGYPLPNPFYKKGGGLFYGASLEQAFRRVIEMSGPFWLGYLSGLVLCLRPLLRLAAPPLNWLARAARALAGELSRRDGWTVFTGLRIGQAAGILVLIAGLFRVSSPLHPVLLFGRYSPSYFAFLLALLVTILAAFMVERRLKQSKERNYAAASENLVALSVSLREMDLWTGTRGALFLLIPAAGYVLMWGMLSDEMNILGRFQYALIPVMLVSWPGFFREFGKVWPEFRSLEIRPPLRVFAALLFVILGAVILKFQYDRYLFTYQQDGRMEAALALKDYAARGYTIATTEAGLLPLYSEWRSVDTWGLNDTWIAHNGGVDAGYLDRYQPEVIMFHAGFSPLTPPPASAEPGSWDAMLLTLKNYAETNGYELAAVYGPTPQDTHYYYVKTGFPDSKSITARIRGLEEEGYIFGGRSLNFIYYQRSEND